MVRTGWKRFGSMSVISAALFVAAGARAESVPTPPRPVKAAVAGDPLKTPPHLVAPKIDVRPKPTWHEPVAIEASMRAAIAQVVQSIQHAARVVPPSSTAAALPERPRAEVARVRVARAEAVPRPKPAGVEVQMKPVDVAPPTTANGDVRGQSATLPGVQVRLPWRVP